MRLAGSAKVEVQEAAAQALCNLAAGSSSNRAAVAAAGAIPVLVRLLCSGSEGVQGPTAGLCGTLQLPAPETAQQSQQLVLSQRWCSC